MSAGAWTSLRRISRLEPGERSRLMLSLVLSVGAVLAATGLLTASGYLISRAAQRPDILRLAALITAVRAFGLSRAVLRYSERLASHDLAFRVLARLRLRFFEVLAPLVPGAIPGHSRGELLARFVGDVDALQDLYLRALAPPLVAALVVIAAGATAALIFPLAALIVVVALLLSATSVPLLTGVLAGRAGRRQAGARAALAEALVEAVDGGAELSVAGRGQDWVEDADRSQPDALSAGTERRAGGRCRDLPRFAAAGSDDRRGPAGGDPGGHKSRPPGTGRGMAGCARVPGPGRV